MTTGQQQIHNAMAALVSQGHVIDSCFLQVKPDAAMYGIDVLRH